MANTWKKGNLGASTISGLNRSFNELEQHFNDWLEGSFANVDIPTDVSTTNVPIATDISIVNVPTSTVSFTNVPISSTVSYTNVPIPSEPIYEDIGVTT
tara:strand:+ start:2290 stop:2586 length:297 start_codon:yes stop_codon:yes gene_type:complete